MTDNDIDQLLARHGESWRAENTDRPGVDWNGVMPRRDRRSWLFVAGAAIAAAAVVVPLVMTVGGGQTRSTGVPPRPNSTSTPPAPSSLDRGSPSEYFELVNGGVEIVGRRFPANVIRSGLPVASIGGIHHDIVYTAQQLSNCRTRVQLTFYPPSGNGVAISGIPQTIATIKGGVDAIPMAVTHAAGTLALVVTPPDSGRSTNPQAPCTGTRQLVLLDLHTGRVVHRVNAASNDEQVDDLHWSANGQSLLYRLRRIDGVAPLPSAGTHLLQLNGQSLATLDAYPTVLPLAADPAGLSYGPAIFWRGAFAAFYNGELYGIEPTQGGRRGSVLASGFPDKVDTVSSDASGNHLLLTSGGRVYRWDYGHLSRLPGDLTEVGW